MPVNGLLLAISNTLYYKIATVPAKKPKDERKDKIIQTRVNEALGDRLKREAKERRLPVSQLIRNVLEDSFKLVGNVVDNVDAIAQDAIGLGRQAGADARRLGRRTSHVVSADEEPHEADALAGEDGPLTAEEDPLSASEAEEGEALSAPSPALEHILAWQEVVLNGEQLCASCTKTLPKGENSFLGISSTPGSVAWLCQECRAEL